MTLTLPAGAVDSHVHVIGPSDRFPLAATRAYTPPEAPFSALTAMMAATGLARVVLVQPSVYGTDNACLVDALERLGSRARGVAVINHATSAQTARLQRLGVRGLRLNLSTLGVRDPADARAALLAARRLAENEDWHIQLYAGPTMIAALESELLGLGLPIVLDHFAGLSPAADDPSASAVRRLVGDGVAYVKLSARYRLPGYPDLSATRNMAQKFFRLNPDAVLWGSDWPHTPAHAGIAARNTSSQVTPFQPIDTRAELSLLSGLSTDGMERILLNNPSNLYGF